MFSTNRSETYSDFKNDDSDCEKTIIIKPGSSKPRVKRMEMCVVLPWVLLFIGLVLLGCVSGWGWGQHFKLQDLLAKQSMEKTNNKDSMLDATDSVNNEAANEEEELELEEEELYEDDENISESLNATEDAEEEYEEEQEIVEQEEEEEEKIFDDDHFSVTELPEDTSAVESEAIYDGFFDDTMQSSKERETDIDNEFGATDVSNNDNENNADVEKEIEDFLYIPDNSDNGISTATGGMNGDVTNNDLLGVETNGENPLDDVNTIDNFPDIIPETNDETKEGAVEEFVEEIENQEDDVEYSFEGNDGNLEEVMELDAEAESENMSME